MFITAAPMPAPIPVEILDMFTLVAMAGASLIALLGFVRLAVAITEGEGFGSALLIAGVGVGLFIPFVILWALGDTPDAAPPTPTPTPTPKAPLEPADLTGVWITFSMIAAVGLLFAAVWGSGRIARHIRRARQAARRKAIARSRHEEAWRAIHAQHDELLRRYLHAETDWDALFFTPALTDPNVPQTRRMLEAMQRATTLRSTSGDLRANLSEDADITALPYARAVADFATAWSVAERHAKRIGQNGIPAPERKRLREARTLLAMIENGASSPTERALAYRRVQKLLEGITAIHLPDKALSALEQRSRPMITPGT